jgi:DNA-binding transcriptional MerR regulator
MYTGFEDLQSPREVRMLRIGTFSKLSQVSIKTLRYYDRIDLLKPVEVDHFTGYRYYSVHQLQRINRILALKGLGFTLEQVSRMLDENLSLAEMQGMLRMRQAELEQQMLETQERFENVAFRLRQIEEEFMMSEHEVLIKKVAAQQTAAIRDVVANYGEQGRLWHELSDYFRQHGVRASGPSIVVDHSGEYRETNVDLEVFAPIDAELPESARVKVKTLPGIETAASILHKGSYDNFRETYIVLMKWIEENGYTVIGPDREIYLHCPGDEHDPLMYAGKGPTDPADFVTEVLFPVKKV